MGRGGEANRRSRRIRLRGTDPGYGRVGRAILLTTITTLISFGGLLFLNHVGCAVLGLLVGLGVGLGHGNPGKEDERRICNSFLGHRGLELEA